MRQTQHNRADQTRDRILRAAIREFSEHGLAGARTGAIASAARVNKALLYYYFRDKEALYTASLEEVASKVAGDAIALLDLDCSPGERVLRLVLQHFDRHLSHHGFHALMQQEMVRFRTGQSNAMHVLAKNAFEPMWCRSLEIVVDGIRSGELCNVDPLQMMYAGLGANVFYFLSAPMVRLVTSSDPLGPDSMAARRTAGIEYLGQTIFTDRRRGARLARTVLAATPMPSAIPERKTA
ncbi:MAG: TetR/AcrR family transcriptional regulator [Acidobacteriaceae bacterium]